MGLAVMSQSKWDYIQFFQTAYCTSIVWASMEVVNDFDFDLIPATALLVLAA